MPGRESKRSSSSRELDVSNATRGVWLVKVPKYLNEAWRAAGAGTELGKMTINSNPRQVEVSFSLAEPLVRQSRERLGGEVGVPSKHRVIMQSGSAQTLCTFSESCSSGEVVAEGRVSQKADIQPLSSDVYMQLKQHQIRVAGKTTFTPQQLEATPATNYRPVTGHKEYLKQKKKEKEEGKRARSDRDTVLDLLFTAFQQHQYYNFRDLVHKTKQPPVYLKEILREVCVYNTKAPHKNTWELKPEYRDHQKPSTSHE